MAGDLADLKRQLADVTADLAAIPAHLRGSEKHCDRLEEQAWLWRAIERMTAARRARAECN